MMKHTLIAGLLAAACVSATAQNLPYSTGFETAQEQADWDLFRLGPAMNNPYEWAINNGSLNHYYPVGGTELTNDWMVSPEIDLTSGVMLDSLDFKATGFGTPFGEDTVALYVISGNKNPALANNIELLYLLSDSSYNPDNMWRTIKNIAIPSQLGNGYLAFRYQTTVNWLDVFVDNISIGATTSIDNGELSSFSFSVMPNPTSERIRLAVPEQERVEQILLTNLNGSTIRQFNATERDLDIAGVAPGIYLLRVATASTSHSTRIVVR